MERNRNWLGLIALVLGGLALVVALGGRFGPHMAYSYQAAVPAVPAAPAPDARFERGRGGPPAFFSQREPQGMARGDESFGRGHGPMMGRGFGRGHGFGPLGLLFGLVNLVTKLVALGVLAWLLLRLFQQRRNGPPPAAPTTPAGHDPRVE
ncbi:MAG: hypothetical protein HGA45_12380 [Chloroflexales bacterium]|nr:hypothetical protein [Chloroflexales bacterium]